MAAHFRAAGLAYLALAGAAIVAACSLNAQPLPPLSGGDSNSGSGGGERGGPADASFNDNGDTAATPGTDAAGGRDGGGQLFDGSIDGSPPPSDAGDAASDAPSDAPEDG